MNCDSVGSGFCIVCYCEILPCTYCYTVSMSRNRGSGKGSDLRRLLCALNLRQTYRGRNSSFVFTPFKLTGNSSFRIYHAHCTHVGCRLSVLIYRYVTIAPGFFPSHHKGRYQPRQACSKWDNAHEKSLNSIHIHWTPVFRPLAVAVKSLPSLYLHLRAVQ